jgi:hypothetical protein
MGAGKIAGKTEGKRRISQQVQVRIFYAQIVASFEVLKFRTVLIDATLARTNHQSIDHRPRAQRK